jgi:hydroxymethylbilane synthase
MTTPSSLRLGTRASPLALAQAHLVRAALTRAHQWPEDRIEVIPFTTSGDKILDRPLAEVGGKALWTKELDSAMLAGEIDFAVHSMKDVETIRPPELRIVAMLERADVRDRLIGAEGLDALPYGAIVGTSAPRRTAQLLRMRPDLKIILFRGNVNTRLAKVANGDADATLLAAAGLDRLGMVETGAAIPVEVMLPAPSQGVIGIEALASNTDVCAFLEAIDHAPTHHCVLAERRLLAALAADCRSPVAAYAQIVGDDIWLRAEIFSEDGKLHQAGEARFALSDEAAPATLANRLLEEAVPELRAAFG